jgi:hypothetical protein
VAGNLLYVSCGYNQKVVAIDLTTDQVVKTYSVPKAIGPCGMACVMPLPDVLIVDGGLWIQWNDGYVQRLDLDSGQTTTDAQGVQLLGDAFGWLWVQAKADTAWAVGPEGPLPDSIGARTSSWHRFDVACGQIWESWPGEGGTTVLAPVDRDSGTATLPQLIVPASIARFNLAEFDSACWLVGSSSTDTTYPWHIARLSDFTRGSAACFAPAWLRANRIPFALDATDWVWQGSTIKQIDMVSGETYGRPWAMPLEQGPVVVANGQVWAQSDTSLVRLDIPLDPVPNQTALPPIVCANQSPSPTSSPTA